MDIVGVNYYLHNQWVDGDLPVAVDHADYCPLSQLLADVYDRYRRPMFLAETGIEGDVRPAWFRVVGHEVAQARQAGVPVEGICLYPVLTIRAGTTRGTARQDCSATSKLTVAVPCMSRLPEKSWLNSAPCELEIAASAGKASPVSRACTRPQAAAGSEKALGAACQLNQF